MRGRGHSLLNFISVCLCEYCPRGWQILYSTASSAVSKTSSVLLFSRGLFSVFICARGHMDKQQIMHTYPYRVSLAFSVKLKYKDGGRPKEQKIHTCKWRTCKPDCPSGKFRLWFSYATRQQFYCFTVQTCLCVSNTISCKSEHLLLNVGENRSQ